MFLTDSDSEQDVCNAATSVLLMHENPGYTYFNETAYHPALDAFYTLAAFIRLTKRTNDRKIEKD